MDELVAEFWKFIEQYHTEVHSETGETPLQYWKDHCLALTVDPRRLDVLLMEPCKRRVIKEGIKYDGRIYWHMALAPLVSENVLIRVEPSYSAPDEIQVFYDGQWICTALATDSEEGQQVTPAQIRAAQREQRQKARQEIEHYRSALEDADQEIEAMNKGAATPDQPEPSNAPALDTLSPKAPNPPKKRKGNLLDRMKD